MPYRMFHGLYTIAMDRLSTDAGKEAEASDQMMDALEGEVP